MLRNLLYSIFFHILFITLLIVSNMDFTPKMTTAEITPLTISFLTENSIDDIEDIEAEKENDKVKNLSLDEKIELYNKIKKLESIHQENSSKNIYEKSDKKPFIKENTEEITNEEATEENEFEYYYTPVYVAEHKINTEEKRKLIENRIKREELRKKMREKNIVPPVDIKSIKQVQKLEDIVKISQRPLVVKKKKDKTKDNNKVVLSTNNTQKENKENNSDESIPNIDDIISTITISNNSVDPKYEGLKSNEIFNENDLTKLKEIDDTKVDSKFLLSLREKINIQRQIKGCYKMAIVRSKKDSKAVIALTVNVAKDGVININNVMVNKISDGFDNKSFEIALENAKSALVFCSPLRGLPVGKYKTWKIMTFVFDSNKLD